MKLTRCVRCGVPLVGRKCAHCGTEYDDSGFHFSFPEDDSVGTLKICGVECAVSLDEITFDHTFHEITIRCSW